MLYSLGWIDRRALNHWCPMHEEPLHLVPERFRSDVAAQLNAGREADGDTGADHRATCAPSAATCTTTG